MPPRVRCATNSTPIEGNNFFLKAASMTGLAANFHGSRLLTKMSRKPVMDAICVKS